MPGYCQWSRTVFGRSTSASVIMAARQEVIGSARRNRASARGATEGGYADSEFSFEVGDRLLLYTDGLLEAENAAGESFGDAALSTFIKEKQEFAAEQFVDLLLKEVLAWSSRVTRAGQEDDITIIAIDIHHHATVEELTYATSSNGAPTAVRLPV